MAESRFHLPSSDTAAGRLLRFPLRFIPPNAVLPILSGPAKGMKWIAGSFVDGCWVGSYERELLKLFSSHIQRGMTVYDIGANVGIYTLVASQKAKRVFAFEPFERNLFFLRRHIALNRLSNCSVIPCAVYKENGSVAFEEGVTDAQGRIGHGNQIVPAVSIDMFAKENPAPEVIKIDVEGGEYDVLCGATEMLKRKPVILIAMHGDQLRCLELLAQYAYKIKQVGPSEDLCF
jgi:FkbM family methyltransferase